MHVSPTYANRKDLGPVLKWKFTIEEHIEQNRRVRAVYKYLAYDAPCWIQSSVAIMLVVSLVIPAIFTIASIWMIVTIATWFDPDEETPLSTWLWLAALVASAIFVPYGWIAPAFPAYFFLWLWFFGVMYEYDEELGRERYKRYGCV